MFTGKKWLGLGEGEGRGVGGDGVEELVERRGFSSKE